MTTYRYTLLFNPTHWQHLHGDKILCTEIKDEYQNIFNTFPVRDISPVIASCCLSGLPIASDSNAETMVQPADGPSLGVAPYNNTFTQLSLYNVACV